MPADYDDSCCYDCIVVGAGIEGSAAAYKIAQTGQRTLLVEQFDLLHTNGSSHGGSRITRHCYQEECMANLTKDMFHEWKAVEDLSGQHLYENTGLVCFSRKASPAVDAMLANMHNLGAPHRELNHEGLLQALPNCVLAEDCHGVYDDCGGVLFAIKAVACFHELFVKAGGEIRSNCAVDDIQPGPVVTVATSNGTFRAKGIVLCPGTWGGKLTSKIGLNLPLQLLRCFIYYWKEKVPGTYSARHNFPCFIDDDGCYGIPALERPGHMKMAIHGGYEFGIDDDPALYEHKPPFKQEELSQYVAEHFPGLEPTPSFIEKCKYTVTPDELFIIDKHPVHKNITIAVGFSGTGFKFAPVIGNILRDLHLNVSPKYDITEFRLDRFATTKANPLENRNAKAYTVQYL